MKNYLLKFFCILHFLIYQTAHGGQIIAFVGISGVGKSTMAKALGDKLSLPYFLEPEEKFWPEIALDKQKFGPFSFIMAFRQMWITQLYKAQDQKNTHPITFLDTFFIKLLHYELEEKGIEWLIEPSNPYFNILKMITHQDVMQLPDPDYLVLFDTSFEDWIQLLKSRNREFDKTEGFIESFYQTSRLIEDASIKLCKDRKIKFLKFHLSFGSISDQANRLQDFLEEKGALQKNDSLTNLKNSVIEEVKSRL